MTSLKYKVIKNKIQYNEYCKQLEDLLDGKLKSKALEDEIELLTLLIEIWEAKHNKLPDIDPVQLLRSFMKDHDLIAKDLVDLLGISKGNVSDILNYKKGFSKNVIRKLADHFKVSQAAFNRPYVLKIERKA
jgi:HTH-type transcriptional regulator/antitoxin HigA